MNISAIILAGGKSSRMGSDKGLLELNGKKMIQHVIEIIQKITDDIIIVSNSSGYEQFTFPVFKDIEKDKGPLGGIHTGLMKSSRDINIVVSCDAPFVSNSTLTQLLEASIGYDITIPSYQGRLYPLIGIYNKACLPVIKRSIETNNLRVRSIFDQLKTNIIDCSDEDESHFTNINTPEELAQHKI
jgi:molybdopterin-guanine dinucleotide biosynthesis protein A